MVVLTGVIGVILGTPMAGTYLWAKCGGVVGTANSDGNMGVETCGKEANGVVGLDMCSLSSAFR